MNDTPYLRIDESLMCTLAICDKCGYRGISGSPATAWKDLAKHAKLWHNDIHAAARARHAKWWHDWH